MEPGTSWADLITTLIGGSDLTPAQTGWAMDEILSGEATPVQIAGFVVALRAKGETVAELVGLARTMRNLSAQVKGNRDDLVDTAGTGGGPTTYNISTTAALIAAGGVMVAADLRGGEDELLRQGLRLWPLAIIALGLALALRRTQLSLPAGVLGAGAFGPWLGSKLFEDL